VNEHPQSTEQQFWIVLDEDGEPCHCASWPEACHEHINEALEEKLEGAERWVVREVKVVPPPPDTSHIYRHQSCVFQYCPHPDICKTADSGCIAATGVS
jgi:hypothetical protein